MSERSSLMIERERPLFIHIRVAHSDAVGTAISWGPDKN